FPYTTLFRSLPDGNLAVTPLRRHEMSCKLLSTAMISTILMLGATLASAAQQPKPVKLNVAQGGAVNVVNGGGSVTVHAGAGNQVIFTGTTHSNKVEIDSSSTPDGRRVDIRTHVL